MSYCYRRSLKSRFCFPGRSLMTKSANRSSELHTCRKYSTKPHNIIRELPDDRGKFSLSNALLVTKLSRYEVEQHRHPELSKSQLEELIRNRGTDYEGLLFYHNVHKEFEKTVAKCFRQFGVNVQSVNRYKNIFDLSLRYIQR